MSTDEDYLLLRGKKVPVRLMDIPHNQLKFWVENPRIYALLDHDTKQPSQEEIFKVMQKLEHVKELRHDIKSNGGLMDPIIVREGDFIVFEGNSRLAAQRSLAMQDPIQWDMIRCKVVPSDTSQEDIYTLLGQYHLKGKKDWMPFEQAGFIQRRLEVHKVPVSELVNELGISQQNIMKHSRVYKMMMKHKEVRRDRWNHYWHMLTNTTIKKALDNTPDLEERLVKLIQNDQLRAVDIRDRLKVICKFVKVTEKFAHGKIDFEDAYEDAKHSGGDSVEFGKIHRFERWIKERDALEDILAQNKSVKDKIKYSLKKINDRINTIINQMEKQEQED